MALLRRGNMLSTPVIDPLSIVVDDTSEKMRYTIPDFLFLAPAA
jgi:hypothetical protein